MDYWHAPVHPLHETSSLKFLAISQSKRTSNAVGIAFPVFGRLGFCRRVNRVILLDTAVDYVDIQAFSE